jgi:hypothetical protein
MAVTMLAAPFSVFLDVNGNPLSGGKVYTYTAGTSTPKATYTDSTGVTQNSNPVILDSAGRAAIWMNGAYKIVLKDSTDTTIYTTDNVTSSTAVGDMTAAVYDPASIREQLVGLSATQTLSNKSVATPAISTTSTAIINAAFVKTVPTLQKFTSGSGTYTTPTGVAWIRVRMVGGGGGGAGGGTTGRTDGGAGGNTTFGTTLLVANGGGGGVGNASSSAGGTASLGTGPIGIANQGVTGSSGSNPGGNAVGLPGGSGGSTPFGGGGGFGGTSGTNPGTAAIANTGAGGGGGGVNNSATSASSGGGGSAGGYVDAIITSPSATYSYAVGAAGSAGSAGTNGGAGGAGGSGFIIVEEFYIG